MTSILILCIMLPSTIPFDELACCARRMRVSHLHPSGLPITIRIKGPMASQSLSIELN